MLATASLGAAREGGPPPGPDAIYRIASMTKPVTIAAFLRLVEQGRVSLDTPVGDVLPEMAGQRVWTGRMLADGKPETEAANRPVTMHDLIAHRSGLTYHFHGETPLDRMCGDLFLDAFQQRRSSHDYAAAIASVPLAFQPGGACRYSIGIDVLGLVIEALTGLSLDRALDRAILGPLRMTDSGFTPPPDRIDRLTDAWAVGPDGRATLVDRGAQSRWRMPQKSFSGGGGMVSTIPDYHRFLRMLLNGGELDGVRLLRPETVDLMLGNQLPGNADLAACNSPKLSETGRRGVGMAMGGAVVIDPARADPPIPAGVYYWGGILSTGFFLDRDRDLIGIVMAQAMPSGATRLRQDFRAAVYRALGG